VTLGARLSELDQVGFGPAGVTRLAWTPEDAACREWFKRQARDAALRVEVDPAGNLWAVPGVDPPWWAVGSHLDSVRGGGRFDGPLGVAAGFELAARTSQPLAVISFADEEGARFNTPTFGSKALAGKLDLPAVLERRDHGGVTLGDAMREFGADPDRLGEAPGWLEKLAGLVEIHIDQSRDVARAEVPCGLVRGLANRMRLEVEITGRADHAGTTPRDERSDALIAAARLIVAVDASFPEMTVTTSRIVVEPNAPTTIAARVRLWTDVRSPRDQDLDRALARLRELAPDGSRVSVASRTAGTEFDAALRAELARRADEVIGRQAPEVLCYAGHDAGVLADLTRTAMVLVRNPTGVSHSPEERVDLGDAEVAMRVVACALEGVG
jgi:N-carbamoyl-L-amino-acid hydrolase